MRLKRIKSVTPELSVRKFHQRAKHECEQNDDRKTDAFAFLIGLNQSSFLLDEKAPAEGAAQNHIVDATGLLTISTRID